LVEQAKPIVRELRERLEAGPRGAVAEVLALDSYRVRRV
jgi:hypothetical protein